MMWTQRGGSQRWIGYVGVDDVDEGAPCGSGNSAERLRPARPAAFLVVTDPERTTIALFKWSTPGGAGARVAASGACSAGNILLAVNGEKAFAFSVSFSAGKWRTPKTGPMGPYQLFSVAGLVKMPPSVSPSTEKSW